MSTTPQQAGLAFERHGTGVPIVLIPGLTFDRRSRRPIVDRLDDTVCTIAIDLPAHGGNPGPPCDVEEVAAQVHGLIESLESASRSSSGIRCRAASRRSTRPRIRRAAP